MIYDYMIVGAGPAGSTLAYCLQRQGAKCLLVEKLPRKTEKTCGGLLTHTARQLLETIGIDCAPLLQSGGRMIRRFTLNKPISQDQHCYREHEYGIGTMRQVLDNYLLQEAIEAGAQLSFGEKIQTLQKKDDIFIANTYRAKQVVLATGANGLLPPKAKRLLHRQSFGISAQINAETDLPDDEVTFWYPDNVLHYFWIIPIGKKRWNIGVWFPQIPQDPMSLFQKYVARYALARFTSIQCLLPPRGGYCGNTNISDELGFPGVGDVAGTNRRDTGEGLRYAIESAIQLAMHSHLA